MKHFLLVFLLIFPINLYAYFDPGSARVVIQAIIAFIVAVGASISIYFRKFKEFISKIFKRKKNN